MSTHHDLKILPTWFSLALAGKLPFQIRLNDRGFEPGDTVKLNEYEPEGSDHGPFYTGSNITGQIKDVFTDLPGLQEGYVAFTLEPLGT